VTTIVPLSISTLGGAVLLSDLILALVQTGYMLPPLFAAPDVAPLPRKLPFLLKMFVLLTWFVRDPRHRQLARATSEDVCS
jgi:hypothetical protein